MNDDRAPLIVDGKKHCKDCLELLQSVNPEGGGYQRLKRLGKQSQSCRCDDCASTRAGIKAAFVEKACALVSKAVRKGLLPRVSTLRCTDCGKPADVYDHRDYNFPLKVEPVCRSCNSMRGSAVLPHPYEAYGAAPTAPCHLCERDRQGSYFAT
jgi:hypothetical protein